MGPILMAVVMAEHNFSKNITMHMPFLSRTPAVLQYSDIADALLAPDIRTTFPLNAFSLSLFLVKDKAGLISMTIVALYVLVPSSFEDRRQNTLA